MLTIFQRLHREDRDNSATVETTTTAGNSTSEHSSANSTNLAVLNGNGTASISNGTATVNPKVDTHSKANEASGVKMTADGVDTANSTTAEPLHKADATNAQPS
jgi:hypothetical protein